MKLLSFLIRLTTPASVAGLLMFQSLSAQVEPPATGDQEPVAAPGQPVPREPLVSRAPVRSEWRIRMSSDLSDSDQADTRAEEAGMTTSIGQMRTIRSIQVSKDGRLQTYQLNTRWSDGTSEDEWIVAGQHVAERANGKGLYIVGSEGWTAQGLQASDFPELGWLDMSYYRGIKNHKGMKVFVFSVPYDKKPMTRGDAQLLMLAKQSDPTMTPSRFFKPKSQEVFVYLNAATQLPVLFNDGNILRTYNFSEPAAERLHPPKQVVEFLAKRQQALKVKLATPPGP